MLHVATMNKVAPSWEATPNLREMVDELDATLLDGTVAWNPVIFCAFGQKCRAASRLIVLNPDR